VTGRVDQVDQEVSLFFLLLLDESVVGLAHVVVERDGTV